MIPLKENKYYVESEVEDDTKEFLRGRPSLSSITYDANSRYNNSFIFEKINIMIDFYKKVNKFNTFLILLVIISFILNCITVHYMSLMKGYVEKNKLDYTLINEKEKKFKIKSYSDNFKYNKL